MHRRGSPRRCSARASTAALGIGLATAVVYVLAFQALYYVTILRATTETKLQAKAVHP